MDKDHYVAQTYLKHFKAKGISKRVNAIRKSDLKILEGVHVKEICQLANWSYSPYHQSNPRFAEDYLKIFEPQWNECIKTLKKDTFNLKTKNYMAGYLAFLRACTPKAVRMSEKNLQEIVGITYKFISQHELNKKSEYADTIRKIESSGGITINIDQEYSKGMTFRGVVDLAEKYLGFEWSFLFNQTQTPFLTSDNPVCIERLTAKYSKFYIPLTPNIGLIIHPDWSKDNDGEERQKLDEFCNIEEDGVHILNELLVKNAEDMVIFNHSNYDWVLDLVKKYRYWRVENRATKIPTGDGYLLITQEMVVEKITAKKLGECETGLKVISSPSLFV